MAAALGLLFSALAGGSKGLATGMEDERQSAERVNLETLRSNLEEQKALRIAEAGRTATRQAGIQQGQDIDNAVTQAQGQRDADAINAANSGVEGGSNMTADDARVLRGQPEARKAYGLLNPTRQSDLEDRANAAEKLGYLDAARETRGALQTENADQRYDQQSKDNNRRLDQQEKRQEMTDNYNQRRENRLDRLAEAQVAYQKSRDAKNDEKSNQLAAREERSATVAAMKGAETDIKQLQKDLADPMLSQEQKTVLQNQLELSRGEARRYRNSLAGAGIDGGEKADKPFDPNNYRSGGDKPSGKSNASTVPNPIQNDQSYEPAKLKPRTEPVQASPRDTAISALELALQRTSKELAAANSSGNKAEVERLGAIFQQQNEARQRAVNGQ
jgi:hypothetical protein